MSVRFLLYLSLLSAVACQTPAEQPKPPNILYIMSDDHTSQAWGIYGSVLDSVIETPNIHRLAEEGAQLMNNFCTNSICVPSRATVMTGQYSNQNQVFTLNDSLNPANDNVAKILQQQGYQTAIIGKWHLKTQPTGFDYYNVLPGQGRYHDPILMDSTNWQDGGKAYEGFSTDVIASQSLEWLKNRDKDKPFMLMCHFKATHEPFDYAERFASLYENMEMPEPESLYDFYPQETDRTFEGQLLEILGERYKKNDGFYPIGNFSLNGLDSVAARKKIYQTFIKSFLRSGAGIDENIGRLLDYLDQEGLVENTVVIYTADQGYFLGEHDFFDKRMMYEESLRMPFVIRYPKEIVGGTKIFNMTLNTDFAPLFLDYAGAKKPASMQGESFRQVLQGNTPANWRTAMYYRYWQHQINRPAHFGIRTRQYKLIFYYGLPLDMTGSDQQATTAAWEFFDLEKDPKELHNAYADAAYQEVIAQLKQNLIEQREKVGDTDSQYPEVIKLMNETR